MAVKVAGIREIYRLAASSGANEKACTATVIRGEGIGEKAYISEGLIQAATEESGFLAAHASEICSIKETGIFGIDGRDVYIELLGGEPSVVICGAGHVSIPIIKIARMMGLYVTVIDDRKEFADKAAECGADEVICKSFDDAMAEIDGSDDTYFVVVTRGHNYDKACVGGALLKPHAYVGMIGSRRHAQVVREALGNEGIAEELINSICTPIGLEIGAETPEEIAVSIMAEIIEIKNKKRKNSWMTKDISEALLAESSEPVILATIVSKSGSGPRTVGTRMIVRKDSTIAGTVGGGIAENDVINRASEILSAGHKETVLMRADMNARPEDEGMVCGGSAEVLLEIL